MLHRLIILAAILVTVPAHAAEIYRRPDGWIAIQGPIVQADGEKFRAVSNTVDGVTTVVFDSIGGSAGASIGIGEEIRKRGFATIVERGKTCVSACAFSWLAGKPRIMDPQARLGFHGVYVMENGKPVTSGAANAVMGAYLGSLGLSPAAIFFVTEAKPDGMSWLTQDVATRLGFDVYVIDPPESRMDKSRLKRLFRRADADGSD